jgi:hypothetical protein
MKNESLVPRGLVTYTSSCFKDINPRVFSEVQVNSEILRTLVIGMDRGWELYKNFQLNVQGGGRILSLGD